MRRSRGPDPVWRSPGRPDAGNPAIQSLLLSLLLAAVVVGIGIWRYRGGRGRDTSEAAPDADAEAAHAPEVEPAGITAGQ